MDTKRYYQFDNVVKLYQDSIIKKSIFDKNYGVFEFEINFEMLQVQRLFNAKCDKHLNCEEIIQQAKKFYNYDEFPEENER